jgi:hypothetical protein
MSKKSIGKQFLSKGFGVTIAMLFVALMVVPTTSVGITVEPARVSALPQSASLDPVNLGSAASFVILAKAGISTTGTTAIVGNIGVSPAAATYITGFDLTNDSTEGFATSALVTGKVYAADNLGSTPAMLTVAVGDMEIAYNDAAGRTSPDYTELMAGDISGLTLTPGLYKWGTDLIFSADVTISGSATDVWIFQISGNLVSSTGTQIILSGGAQVKNIFWQVAGAVSLGTYSAFNGNILCLTAIVLNTGATLNGRALAQTAVTLDSNTITGPPETIQTPDPDPTPLEDPNDDADDDDSPKIDGYPFLAIGVIFLGTIGLIAILKRKHFSNV